jgi:hypothetical protein
VGYCSKCFKEERPHSQDQFLVFGATSQSYQGRVALRTGRKGFTPHLYEYDRLIKGIVYFKKLCCMCDCGAYLATYQEKTYIYTKDEAWIDEYTTLANWNALCLFKNTGFEI